MGRSLRVALVASILCAGLVLAPAAQAQEFVWAKRLGGPGSQAIGNSTALDAGGNVYTVGDLRGTCDFDPGPGTYNLTSAGYSDGFISKLDSAGNFLWAKRLGGGGYDVASTVVLDDDGSVYNAGYFQLTADFDPGPGTYNLTSAAGTDAYFLKLDSAGNFLWAKRLGGAGDDSGGIVGLDAARSIYTYGNFSATVDFDPGPGVYNLSSAGSSDAFISKLDSTGNFLWAKRLGGAGNDTLGAGTLGAAGNLYTVGYFEGTSDFDPGPGTYNLSSAGGRDVFISKLDSAGNFLWAKRLGGTSLDQGFALAVEGDGAVYTTGNFVGTSDFDPGPGTYNLTSAGSSDAFICKLDSAGNFLWAGQLGGPGSQAVGISAALDAAGNLYTVGDFQVTADFDPGPGVYNLSSAGGRDAFICKLDSGGSFLWSGQIGGTDYESAYGVALDAAGNLYTLGNFIGTADFDPGPGTYNLTSAGISDLFVTKLTNCIPSLTGPENYGGLLFAGTCAQDASILPGVPGDPYVYDSLSIPFFRFPRDRFYLSSTSDAFTPLIVDDAVHINSLGTGLRPYSFAAGVPPFKIGRPMEENLVPEPAYEVTSYLPEGQSTVLFDLLDTQREIYGNTAVFLVKDCDIKSVTGTWPTYIDFLSHDDSTTGSPTQFDVVYGLLSGLRITRDFSQASCLGVFTDTPAASTLADPPPGNGFYFLARGRSSCVAQGYGDSSLTPDPRDALEAASPCP